MCHVCQPVAQVLNRRALLHECPERTAVACTLLDTSRVTGYVYFTMTNTKAILVGGFLGILSTLLGVSVAKADCSQDSRPTASELAAECEGTECDGLGPVVADILAQDRRDAYMVALSDSFRCETNYGEVIKTADGYEAWCVPDVDSEACLEVSSRLDCSTMSEEACDDTMGRMYDACLALVHAVGEDYAVAWPQPARR